VGRADDRPKSGCSGELVESRVKTEIGDYRGFYANVRDADPWRGAARFDGRGRIPRDPVVGVGSPELRRGPHVEGEAIEIPPRPRARFSPCPPTNGPAGGVTIACRRVAAGGIAAEAVGGQGKREAAYAPFERGLGASSDAH